jgi:hypothetical protein
MPWMSEMLVVFQSSMICVRADGGIGGAKTFNLCEVTMSVTN